jgi:colicin import membrane protein
MSQQTIDRSVAVLQSLGIHAVFAVVLVFGLKLSTAQVTAPPIPVAIQAVVVDRQAIVDAREEKRRQEQQQLRQEAADRRRKQQEIERQQQAEAEQQRQREAAVQRRRQEDDARQRAIQMEREKQAELQRKQLELRKQREQLAEERRKQEQEYERLQEQKRLQEIAEQQRKDEQRRQQLMDLEQRQVASAEQATLEQQWIALVQSIVTSNWQRPPTAREGLRCLVQVHQAPGGQVLDVAILPGCNGDTAVQRTIVNAVWRSDPLPYKGYEQVLRRQFKFEFVY